MVLRYRVEGAEVTEKGEKKVVLNFQEEFTLPLPGEFFQESLSREKVKAVERSLFGLHLAAGTTYWKIFCPPQIVINSGSLTDQQAHFWERLYREGMGQFYFENQLDPNQLAPKFPVVESELPSNMSFNPPSPNDSGEISDLSGYLLPWGGGKDSIVASELLKEKLLNQKKDPQEEILLFSVRNSLIQQKSAEKAQIERIVADRKLADNLQQVQSEGGGYAGHVPITAIYAFVEALVAIIWGKKTIVMANEKSADEENLIYKGLKINHQYSKTSQFEQDFQTYLSQFVTPSLQYFSILRGYYEIKIAQIFAQYPQYFESFSSCNRNFSLKDSEKLENASRLKENSNENFLKEGGKLWCGKCPKCGFVFLLLAAFLPKEEVVGKIFGQDLLDNSDLKGLFEEILGLEGHKPLECVGTVAESRLAMLKVIEKGEFQDSVLVSQLAEKILLLQEEILAQEGELMGNL